MRDQLGLGEPFAERLVDFAVKAVTFDFGRSVYTQRPVLDDIADAAPETATLAGISLVIATILGLAAGIAAAVRRGRLIDRGVSALSAVGSAVPPFIIGYLLIIPFAIHRSTLPATGFAEIGEDGIVEWIRHLILPCTALAVPLAAEIARQTRSSLVETLEQDYIRTLRAAGLGRGPVVLRHGLRNAALPIVTVIGLQLGRLLGGTVVVERIFNIPGFGTLIYTAVLNRDLPVIQGVVMVSAVLVLVANVLVDASHVLLNPRLRHAH